MAPFRLRRLRVLLLAAALVVFGVYKFGFPSLNPPPGPGGGGGPAREEHFRLGPHNGAGSVGDVYPGAGAGPGAVSDTYLPLPKGDKDGDDIQASLGPTDPHHEGPAQKKPIIFHPSSFDWSSVPEHFPVTDSLTPLPTGRKRLPRVQHDLSSSSNSNQDGQQDTETETRRIAVKAAFLRCWDSYRNSPAWLRDELLPVSGGGKTTFGGWSATLVDALDTLWIMGLDDEFRDAAAAAVEIDFSNSTADATAMNLFETTIRHLGGLLSAYDLSGEEALKEKAVELGEMLYHAFDTHNRMPGFWFVFEKAKAGGQTPGSSDSSASPGSLSMEFTRLSQITGDPKFYDAVVRIKNFLKDVQSDTQLPGMWPMRINFNLLSAGMDNSFTIGAAADSLYEYLIKTHLLLGGADGSWLEMYKTAARTVERHLLFRPMIPPSSSKTSGGQEDIYQDVLFPGTTFIKGGSPELQPEAQHLSCFAGGMFALGGKILSNPSHVSIGSKITRGCIWAYNSTATGIMPEIFNLIPCPSTSSSSSSSSLVDSINNTLFPGSHPNMISATPCAWNETLWEELRFNNQNTPKGITLMRDSRYMLRPEAIESVFVLYRITGDPELRNVAWRMFTAIMKATKTELGNSAIKDVTAVEPVMMDSMESFWLAETLKYFYLIFSPPDLISLDDYVFNTEAHPFKRPK